MDKLLKSNNSDIHKPEDITDGNKKCESNDVEKNPVNRKSRVRVNAGINPQGNAECEIATNVVQAEKPQSKTGTAIQQLLKIGTLATSPELIAQEIKMKAGLSAQDRFRLRVPIPENRMERVCNNCNFYPVNEPRSNAPLLVFDVDSLGLIDSATGAVAQSGGAPIENSFFLDLLNCAYKNFDIAIWSSVQMSDLVPKLEMFDLFKSTNDFKIQFILDGTSMTPTFFHQSSKVKDIEIVWTMFTEYNEHNSIKVDDYLKDQLIKLYSSPSDETDAVLIVDPGLKGVIQYLAGTIHIRTSLYSLNELMAERYG